MKIKVVPNYYAPKIEGILNDFEKIHCIVYEKCNFKCIFCDFWQRNDIVFKEITLDNFSKVVEFLIKESNAFKFTGGEPCLNPDLKEMMNIIKTHGGIVFLDTNGSMFTKVKELVDEKLIDVIGISLKGNTPIEAQKNSGIRSDKACWSNVIESIKYATQKNIKTIVTRVIYNKITEEELVEMATILSYAGNNIYLKINNLMISQYNNNLSPLDEMIVINKIENFINQHSEYKGRIIYINDKSAVHTKQKIQHF